MNGVVDGSDEKGGSTEGSKHGDPRVAVRVLTTSGSYPAKGHEAVPSSEAVIEVLKRAAAAMGIANTSEWVAKINGNEIDTSQTYAALHLHGEVKIDFGKREAGGG